MNSVKYFLEGDHTFMTSKQKGGGEVLKFITCRIHLLLIFVDVGGAEGQKNGHFCGNHKWMTPRGIESDSYSC